MPPRPSPAPLLAVAGGTLVAAPRRPPGPVRPAPRGPYGRLLAVPGARAFTVWNLLARLPMGMSGVSAVLMISAERGSYALAGAVTATGLGATAVVGPWTARLVDRHGQARVAVPAAAVAALGSLALVLCVRYDAPAWTLFAAYAATATTPNTGGMSRARWAHLLRGDPAALHTANSFEQAVDEACFMLGPVVATLLCTAVPGFPELGSLVAAGLFLSGVTLFAAQRRTEPPASGAVRSGRSPLRGNPALAVVLATFLCTGAVFGSLEVVTVAFADGLGHRSAAGAVLGLQAAGSCAAGLLYGLTRPAGPVDRRFRRHLAAMAAMALLPLLAGALGSLLALAGALLVAGAATAPTMVTGMRLVQGLTPAGRLNEGMTLAVTGLLGGIAAGSAAGGWCAEHLGAAAGYGVPALAAALARLTAAGGRSRGPSGGGAAPRP
ncbi:transporter [Streptomyces eurocidicus]|uniref:MFS family permease n=1 Tax=Streptomyces eurocidicus TaxID=66423 RepID=A0A2N8P3L4_STREU|nr:MFS transporter [Streptomyces eurocidicus]MBB5122682.1 MFS family permease [Streptomyces eurocidicus]MBF6055822.1 MFS transporter [Streptomyces eurocidicus]PNE35612.1 transporter [Streptomyces eurocidicus]